MRRYIPIEVLVVLVLTLCGCGGPRDEWYATGYAIPPDWKPVVAAALRHRPCVNKLHQCWGGEIRFRPGPFPCERWPGDQDLCNGTSEPGLIQVNAYQSVEDVWHSTLPWELANVLLQCCEDDYTERSTLPLYLEIMKESPLGG